MSNRIKNLAGQRFYKLLAIRPTDNRIDHKVIWECLCDCGKTCYIRSTYLVQGWSKSCGCYKYKGIVVNGKSKLESGLSARNQLYDNYKRHAKNRGLNFNLTKEEFTRLTSSNCFYCNIEPLQEQKVKGGNGMYIYNGVDRVDSKKGYVADNCVPCCGKCNVAKTNRDLKEFKEWIIRLYNATILEKPRE